MTHHPTEPRETDANHSAGALDLTTEEVLDDFRTALVSRATDDVEENWKLLGRVKFEILGAGQEIAQVCAARELRLGDWMRGYYRGMAEGLATDTTTVRGALAQVLGNTEDGCDPASGGRMMGRHFGMRLVGDDGELIDLRTQVNRASDVSSTGSQFGAALGLALASKVFQSVPELGQRFPTLSRDGSEVAHVSIGDASMAEGIVLESISQAVVQHVPLVISVYDNGYGISVPVEQQIPHGSVSRALSGLRPEVGENDGLHIVGPVNGWDYVACRRAYREAFDYVRSGGGPALVHSLVTQPRGHSSSGDHRRYKDAERLAWEEQFDPIAHMREWILSSGIASADDLEAMEAEVKAEVERDAEAAWEDYYRPIVELGEEALDKLDAAAAACDAPPASYDKIRRRLMEGSRLDVAQQFLTRTVILEEVRHFLIASRQVQVNDEAPLRELSAFLARLRSDAKERFGGQQFAEGSSSPCEAPSVQPTYDEDDELDTGAHIISAGVATLMAQDPRVVNFGEDTGQLGGVTTCSLGLQGGRGQVVPALWKKSPALRRYVPEEGFGRERVWDVGIAEATIVGAAAGLAIRGLRPIAEIQYLDYANYGLQQMTEEMACLRHRTVGGQECPAIVWCQGHRLLGMWHSGSPMGLFLTTPGLRVVVPRNAIQAVGMYRATLQHGRDPAFVVVPLIALYNQLRVPDNLDSLCIPLGHSEVLRPGEHLTVITYGHCCELALGAAEEVQELYNLSVEVVDLQTLNPLDLNGVARDSIARTGRVLFLDEDYPNGAMGMVSKTLLFDREITEGAQTLFAVESVRVLTSPEHKPCYGEDGGFFSKPQIHEISESLVEMWNESLPKGESPIDPV